MNENDDAGTGPAPANDLRGQAEQRLRDQQAAPAEGLTQADARALVHELQVHQIELEMQNEELLRARAAAEEASQKYQDLFDFAPVGHFLWDHEGRIREVNLAGAALLGEDRNAVVRKRFGQSVALEHRATFADFCHRVLAGDTKQTCEVQLLKDGRAIEVLVEGIAAQEHQGPERLCRAAVIDISQQKRADALAAANHALQAEIVARKQAEGSLRQHEEQLRQRAEELAAILEAVPTPVFIAHDPDSVHISGNRAADELLRNPRGAEASLSAPAEARPRHFRAFRGGRELRTDELPAQQAARGVIVRDFEFSLVFDDGTTRHVLGYGTPLRNKEGRSRGAVHVLVDITELKRAEEEIRSLAEFPQENPNPILRVSGDGAVLYANQPAVRVLDLMGWQAGQPLPEPLLRPVRRVLDTGERPDFDLLCPVGRTFSFTVARSSRAGQVNLYARDITERKHAEAERQKFVSLADQSTEFIGMCDLEYRPFYVNETGRRLVGLDSLEQAWRTPVPEFFFPEDQRFITEEFFPRVLREGRAEVEIRFRHLQTGEALWMICTVFLIQDAAGQPVGLATVSRNITERKHAEEALRASREGLDRAQSVARCGSWRLNVQRNELLWSDENWRIFGVPRGTPLTYETFLATVHPDDRALVHEKWSAALRGEPYEIEHRIVVGDQIKWVRERAEIEFDPQGRLLGGFGTTQDITAKKHAEETLAAAKAAADAANVAKSQFLANMSHELRTPMNAILGMTDLALQEELSPTLRDFLQTAKQSADTLLELLNEILDLSRIEAGGFQLEATPFDLRKTVDQAIKTLSVQAYEKGLELACDLGDVPTRLIGDPLRLRQVLVNLVGNAVKFTHRGEVVLRVRAESGEPRAESGELRAESGEQLSALRPPLSAVLRFSVSDTGIGIAPEDRERIFAPFVQADASTTRDYGGTGLGLTIVSKLVELMGGRIEIESEPGQGSTFHFTVRLGIHQQAVPMVEAAAPALSPAPSRSLRVLLAEDTPANQKLVSYVLGKRGHHIEVVQNGQQAWEILVRQDFDAVLMDVQMPVMDGFQATQAIRQLPDPKKAHVPIIALTAHVMKGDAERCLAAGMDSYLSKPIHGEELIGLLERLTEPTAGSQVNPASPPTEAATSRRAAPPATAACVFDLDKAVKHCAGKYNLLRQMVGFFFSEADALLEQMRSALGNGHAAEMRNAAHRLKGTLCYLGAASAGDATQRVEQLGRCGDLTGAAEAIRELEEQLAILKQALAPHRPA